MSNYAEKLSGINQVNQEEKNIKEEKKPIGIKKQEKIDPEFDWLIGPDGRYYATPEALEKAWKEWVDQMMQEEDEGIRQKEPSTFISENNKFLGSLAGLTPKQIGSWRDFLNFFLSKYSPSLNENPKKT